MAEVAVALIGGGGHQFTPAEVAAAGAEVRFSVERPSNLDAAIEFATNPPASGLQLASIMLSPVSERVAAACALLELGCNVILERPAALSSDDLNRLDLAAKAGGVRCWERATTPFEQPYRRIKELLNSGSLGEIVLINFQRSYPWAEWRNSDEAETGGLVLQSASYGLDLVCNLAMRDVSRINIAETTLGEPIGRPLRMAAIVVAELHGGALASICVDYLNPNVSPWAREEIKVLGSTGRLELDSVAGVLKVINPDGEVTERAENSQSQFLSEVISAVKEGRDTDPSAESLGMSTRILIGAREKTPSNWHTYEKAGWPE
jgi:predicted dehydrogenase